ncbi:MAG: hypothetical protein IBJ11_00770 [Phycisphaerales bacterium]|nr:hypothetical protein [Phycisphaerales bacterium]
MNTHNMMMDMRESTRPGLSTIPEHRWARGEPAWAAASPGLAGVVPAQEMRGHGRAPARRGAHGTWASPLLALLTVAGLCGHAIADASTPRMVVHSRKPVGQHYYSQWNSGFSSWDPMTLMSTYPAEGQWVVAGNSPLADEVAIGVLDSSNSVRLGFYRAGSFIAPVTVCTNTASSTLRPFSVAYTCNGQGMIAYWRDASTQIGYRTFSGGTVSAEQVLTPPTNNNVSFLQLVPKPKTSTMVMLTVNSVKDLVARFWNGSAWDTTTTLIGDTGPNTQSRETFALAFEQNAGDGILVYGSNVSGNMPCYRTVSGTTWGPQTLLPGGYNAAQWVRLAARPNSDHIIVGLHDDNNRVYVNFWNGSGWNASSTLVTSSAGGFTSRRFDVAYQPDGNAAVVMYSDNTGVPKYRVWNGSSWGAQQSGPNIGSVPLNIELSPGTSGAQIFAVIKETAWDLKASTWDGTSWSAPVVINDNPGGTTITYPFMIVPSTKSSPCGLQVTGWRELSPDLPP